MYRQFGLLIHMLTMLFDEMSGRLAWWLATCARKPKVLIKIRLLAMYRGELSSVITRLMSKCVYEVGGSGREELNK